MAYNIGVVGAATTGKTTGLRNLPPEETFIITPFKSNLPFPGAAKQYTPAGIQDGKIIGGNVLKLTDIRHVGWAANYINENMTHIKYLVIEDITHFFNNYTLGKGFRAMGNDSNKTWTRWADFGADVYDSLFISVAQMRSDLFIIDHFHTEEFLTAHGAAVKLKTPGKLLENQVNIDSYFEVMLFTDVVPVNPQKPVPTEERYRYVTNNDGYYPAKTPMGMFDSLYIPNDMMAVIERIKAFSKGK